MPTSHRALVTGGNRGIGRAIAAGLLDRGLDVVVATRTPEAGAETARALGCDWVTMDLADRVSLAKGVAQAGPVDVLINNAGILSHAPLFSDDNDFDAAMEVMAAAPFHLIRAVLPEMARRGYGRVVNLSSGWGAFAEGLEGPGAYGIAKAALNAITLAGARAAPDGVKINAMCPGWVATRMGGAGATKTPEEGADTALWLATLPPDGPTGGFFRDRQPIPW